MPIDVQKLCCMDNGKPAAAYILAVPIENIGLFFLQTLGIYPFTFGGYPRYLIARCCTIGGVLHLQLHLLFNRGFFLLQLFDLIRKLLPLIQQVADGIQIGSFVSIICRVQLMDLLCIVKSPFQCTVINCCFPFLQRCGRGLPPGRCQPL